MLAFAPLFAPPFHTLARLAADRVNAYLALDSFTIFFGFLKRLRVLASIHIMKLCVGVDSLGQLLAYEKNRDEVYHIHTRNAPKRKYELIAGGSLYWVIKGLIVCRRRIVSIEENEKSDVPQSLIGLSKVHYPTEPQPRRAFQGWRYLTPEDAPKDLDDGGSADLPAEMIAQLKEAGVW
jgi:hypothetical protein